MKNKTKIFIASSLLFLGVISGVFYYIKTFESEIVRAYDSLKPINGHSWAEMQCTSDLCIDDTNHRVGVGTDSPKTALDVNGVVKLGTQSTCDSNAEGSIRYNSTNKKVESCNGTNWEVISSAVDYVYNSTCVSGGGITCTESHVGSDVVYKFTATNPTTTGTINWTVPEGVYALRYLVVGGGGAGGSSCGSTASGGGGAGGMLVGTGYGVNPGQIMTVTVGAGGTSTANYQVASTNGSNSALGGGLIAIGGGRGGNYFAADYAGGSGGSGGGGTYGYAGGQPTSSQGNVGGSGSTGTSQPSGGGGGAGAIGGNATSGVGGNGGNGLSNDITGTGVIYAGGGAGNYSYRVSSAGTFGTPGSGGGGSATLDATGGAGADGFGGGGGASNSTTMTSYAGGRGGSGVVIVRFLEP